MAIKNPWSYYYNAKDALQMVEAYFVFNGKEDEAYRSFESLWIAMKEIGTALADNVNNE